MGIGIVPESAALRHQQTMSIATVALTDDWAVRERYLLVRDLDTLPVFARTLIDTLLAQYAIPIKRQAHDCKT